MDERFDIATVRDFLHVPKDRRDLCLREFALFLDLQEDIKTLLTPPGCEDAVRWDGVFHWINDDKGNFAIKLKPMPEAPHVENR